MNSGWTSRATSARQPSSTHESSPPEASKATRPFPATDARSAVLPVHARTNGRINASAKKGYTGN